MDFENLSWVKQFHVEHGRPIRTLHIGNIANNAYNNAKLLREIGLISDVICYDYYHIMGTPEWEDADFNVKNLDHFFPRWSDLNLGDFIRPDWFVQGPLELCIDYLIAKNNNENFLQKKIWKILSQINQTEKSSKFNITYLCYNTGFKIITRLGFKFKNLIIRIQSSRYYPLRPKNKTFKYELLNEKIQEIFPDRAVEVTKDDFYRFSDFLLKKWKRLFSNYDVVIGYSTDGIYPLLTNTPYIAFEHGTIRDIPYQKTSQGRLCALTYSLANHVFVTNFDCKKSADFLSPNRYSLINHPFDENHSDEIMGADELRIKLLQDLDSDFLFFFPTRHDWVEGTGYADKANNVFLNAFAKLRHLGFRVGAVCCEWGQNIEDSKKLLSDSYVDDYVQWSDPMATVQFERTAMACDYVVDQFKLGSFGGILFKAMAAGSPVMTYLNEEMLKEQFSEMPPVLNCKCEKDIIDAIKSIYEKPEAKEILSQKSRDWINRHHSKRDTINKQLAQFKVLLQYK
jgi:hypothetical protein